jgi:hypothetical protein
MVTPEDQSKQALMDYFFELDLTELAENEGEVIYLHDLVLLSKTSLDWVLYWNRENYNYTIRSRKEIYRLSRSRGKIVQSLLHLIYRCQEKLPPIAKMLLPDLDIDKQDPWLWFMTLLVEDIHHDLYRFRHSEKLCYSVHNRYKDSVMAAQRSYIKRLESLHEINLLIPPEFENKCSFYLLIEKLIYQDDQKSDILEKEYWKSYIAAMRADWAYQQKSEKFVYGTIEAGKLIVNTGPGRGKRIKKAPQKIVKKN